MQLIETVTVNNKELEISQVDKNNFLIFNLYNNRTIKSNLEVVEYFRNNPNITQESPVYNFVEKKKATNILDIVLFKISIDNKYISKLSSFASITNNNILVLLSLIITLVFIFFSNGLFNFSKISNLNYFILLIYIYAVQVVITALHELSHFYFYQKSFKTKKTNFGITLRYFFLVLFFTSVPFMNLIEKKKKNNLILAGIKTQISISGVLCLIGFIFSDISVNIYFKILFYYNLIILLTNVLPFFKLDGYWYISNVLNSENYMNYYFNMLLKKQKFNIIIFFIGSLNIVLIMLFVIFSTYGLYNLLLN
ncbi:Zn-dependent proteases [Streptococcus pneumoniae]|uniref:hypothetical protein n=1 Tax=Streptococcus pneumoniae TaxID=1313 RepID=UPI0005E581C9|nr:hypothetical protein [Streptococcus pneumoniae]CIT19239.1 Zn-dependent proteases [Streptococcus pneumoniae]